MGYVASVKDMIGVLREVRPDIGNDSIAGSVPMMTSKDLIAMLVVMTPALVLEVATYSEVPLPLGQRIKGQCPEVRFTQANGSPLDSGAGDIVPYGDLESAYANAPGSLATSPGISAKQYVAGWSVGSTPWIRSATQDAAYRYTVSSSEFPDKTQFLRGCMTRWQRCIAALTNAMKSYGFDLAIGLEPASEFLRALIDLAVALESSRENPPASWNESIRGAFGAALRATESTIQDAARLGGEALAKAGEIVGNTAAAVGEGFMRGAGPMTLAVAAVVVYIAYF